jgi:hypothetical protein
MKRVAVLPLDDRPVNYDYPRYLSRAAGLEILLPPREWLGNPWRASRHADLVNWLAQTAPQVDAMVLAIDTLAYGGLIPSRTSSESTDTVLARLEILRGIHVTRPQLPMLAFSVVMRINRSNSSEEEKPYCAKYGSRLFQLSFLEHKAELGDASTEEIARRDSLRAEIPNEVYEDFRRGRARNHAVNRAMVDWAADGVFDYLLLPQDDTADFGWNVAEARNLQAYIRARRLAERAITYPGADEIGCLLLARYVCQQAGFKPKIWPRYSGVTTPSVITDYEDRPIHELLKAHLAPLGGFVADSPQEADLTLYINGPVTAQGNGDSQWLILRGLDAVRSKMPPKFQPWLEKFFDTDGFHSTRREMQSPSHNPEEFVRALLATLASDHPVAIADVAYVNASDLILGELLRQQPQVARLAAYGGWNTAGNTLGTVLAQAIIRVVALRSEVTREQLAAHLEFLCIRFLDDDLYQAHERTRCMVEDLPALGLSPSMDRLPDDKAVAIEASMGAHLGRAAADLRDLFVASGLVRDVHFSHIHLPWQRLFEVGFNVEVELD